MLLAAAICAPVDAAVPPPAAAKAPVPADAWPRRITLSGAAVLIYAPQVTGWVGNQIDFRSAVAIKPAGAKGETFGVVTATARTRVDRVTRMVSFDGIAITGSDFPTLPDRGKGYAAELQAQLASVSRTITLDRLQASLAASGFVAPTVAVQNDPPRVIVSNTPAILVPIAGAPVWKPVPGAASFQRVINTRALMLKSASEPQIFLKVYDGWLMANSLEGPWTQPFIPPAGIDAVAKQVAATGVVDVLDGGPRANPKPSLAQGIPAVYTSQVPAELVVFKGAPEFAPIVGTGLMWATNTTGDVLRVGANGDYYVLLAGRWFRSAALAGPWSFVASNALPPDFAKIPPTSLAGAVLPTVAGTPQAQEAQIEIAIPQTATVPLKNGPTFTATYDGAPQFVPVPGTPLSRASNSRVPVIQTAPNAYYAVRAGIWFTAAQPTGPWAIATSVPASIFPATFRGRLDATTFDPGPLAEEKAYFWRIDEVAADGQIHPGDLWSFVTLGPGGGIKADYFNNMSRYGEPVVTRIDPNVNFEWGDDSPDPAVEPDYFSARWTGDLEPVFSDTYTFTVRTNGYVTLWVNGVKLIERRLLTPAAVEDKGTMELAAGRTYPIQVEYEVGRGQATIQLFWQSATMPRQIIPPGSLQPPVRAREPFPAAGAIETQHDLKLRWTPGWRAAQHDVYFGRDAAQVAAATTGSPDVYVGRLPGHATEVRSGELEWNRKYYWRIDEVNEAEPKGLWKGNVWSFTTADFLPVDDFEGYSDEDGSRIYETWVDGWINGTGSTVGYVVAGSWPIRVHRGAQSMPFDYNNVRPPHYSETQRTWSTPRDWTAHGVNALSLWFAGTPVSFRETPEGSVVISGSGGEMECTYDPYRFVYRRLDGDGTIIARVDSLSQRPGLGPGRRSPRRHAGHGLAIRHRGGHRGIRPAVRELPVRQRPRACGPCTEDISVPYWVKLTRTGNQLTAGLFAGRRRLAGRNGHGRPADGHHHGSAPAVVHRSVREQPQAGRDQPRPNSPRSP